MLARVRISVPDRPGSLGRVSSAIGAVGGDIEQVGVLQSEGGRAVDDVLVRVRDGAHLQRVTSGVAALAGVEVTGVQCPAPPAGGHTELELVQQVLAHPERSLRTLVDGAPGALGVDRAALVEFAPDGSGQRGVLATGGEGPGPEVIDLPGPLRLVALRLSGPAAGGEQVEVDAALVPLTGTCLGLVLLREHGLGFHASELWRLGPLGAIVGPAVLGAARASVAD